MAGFNRIIMMGNFTRDPELKQLPSGQSVCRLGIAANRQFKNRQSGEMMSEVCFVDVDVWGAQAESSNQYLSKGRPVLVEGRLKLDSWQDSEGRNRSKHCIVADRVVFMPSSMQNDDLLSDNNEQRTKAQEDILKQVEELAGKQQAKATFETAKTEETKPKAAKKKEETFSDFVPNSGEVDLKDNPPFQDDLPF